jgi:hypothetical protein
LSDICWCYTVTGTTTQKLLQVKLKKTYGHYLKFGLYRIAVYSGFWFIQGSGLVYSGFWFGLYRIAVYSGFWFIQGSGLYRVLVYSGFWFGLFRVLVYSGFWFGLFRVLVYSGFC